MSDDNPLSEAVAATLARMAAMRDSDAQLSRRRAAIRRMHYERGIPKAEVARQLVNALRDQGLTAEELKDAGVAHDSVMKVLRSRE